MPHCADGVFTKMRVPRSDAIDALRTLRGPGSRCICRKDLGCDNVRQEIDFEGVIRENRVYTHDFSADIDTYFCVDY